MQIKGTTYKVSIPDDPVTPLTPEEKQAQDDQIYDYFMADGTTPSDSTKNSDPINDYMFGQYKGDVKQTNAYDDGGTWLVDFPPTLEELVMKNQNVASNLDIAQGKYEKAQSDLQALADSYKVSLDSGEMGASEIKDIQHRLGLAQTALAKCQEQLDKITKLNGSQEAIYTQEAKTWKDLNNDNWIGKPGNIACITNKDGTITYMDAKTKTVLATPFSDASYSAKIAEDGIEKIDKATALNSTDEEGVDIYLKLNEAGLSKSGPLGSQINLEIPETFWVEKKQASTTEKSSTTSTPYETYYDDKSGSYKMKIYNEWDSSSGTCQKIPSDLSGYVQVQVTKVVVRSESCGLKDDKGNALYNHYVEYYNGDDLITRVRIEGCESSSSPYACTTEDGKSYVAASSVGITLDGNNRVNPCEIDASTGFKSTGFTSADDIETVLGISNVDNKKGAKAYDAILKKFKGTSGYVAESSDNSNKEKSGINIINTRGKINGTVYNDIVKTNGANEYSDYAKEHMATDTKKISQGDPFYNNYVDGNKGTDIVVTAQGNDYVFNAAFYWSTGASTDIKNVKLADLQTKFKGSKLESKENPVTFVHGDGGQYYIYNPDELDLSKESKAEDNDGLDAIKKGYNNDFYEVVKGSGHYANAEDEDIFGDNSDGCLDDKTMEADAITVMEKWENQLTKVPEIDTATALASLGEILKSTNETTVEMDSFFDEWMGQMNELESEGGEAESTADTTGTTNKA